MEKSERKSSLELLRILCIFGIIFMHVMGGLKDNLNFVNGQIDLFANSIFNAGVTIFILISGYFGIKLKKEKMFKLWFMIFFYSVFSYLIEGYYSHSIQLIAFLKACIPIITVKYWFLTCYFILCFLSPFINEMVEKFDKKTNLKLIAVLLIFFSIIPTIFTVELLNDKGKGIVNMILIYLIGRYINKYKIEFNRKNLVLVSMVSIITTYIIMAIISNIKGEVTLRYLFRDNSSFIIITAICIFMIFKSFNLQSKIINNLSKYVLAIYVFEQFVRLNFMKNHFVNLQEYVNKPNLYLLVIAYCLITILICIITEKIRKTIFTKIEDYAINKIIKMEDKIRKLKKIKKEELLEIK